MTGNEKRDRHYGKRGECVLVCVQRWWTHTFTCEHVGRKISSREPDHLTQVKKKEGG